MVKNLGPVLNTARDDGNLIAVAHAHEPGRLPAVLGAHAAVILPVLVGHQAHGAAASFWLLQRAAA